jgi:GxxExxY protein
MKKTKKYINDLTYKINGAIIEVHKAVGPGLVEPLYQKCLKHEFTLRGIPFVEEKYIPFSYKGLDLSTDLRCDLLVDECVMLELKAVKEVTPYFKAKLISQMKMCKVPRGILVNFNVKNIMDEGHWPLKSDYYDELEEQ